jgi:hypothetical protein
VRTENAQRRLLEALADLRNMPDPDIGTAATPLAAFAIGVELASDFAAELRQPGNARIFTALADLARAVDLDQQQESTHG